MIKFIMFILHVTLFFFCNELVHAIPNNTWVKINTVANPNAVNDNGNNNGRPQGRSWFPFVYHPGIKKTLIFGGGVSGPDSGSCGGGYINDVWAYDSSTESWEQVKPVSASYYDNSVWPPGMDNHVMAYDSNNNVMWILGGTCGGGFGYYDYSSNTFTKVSKPNGPVENVYDPGFAFGEGKIVVFSGEPNWIENPGYRTSLFDVITKTWTYSSSSSSPPPRMQIEEVMVYDSYHKKFVIFGGQDHGGRPVFGDTWEYDLPTNTWTETTPSVSPSPRFEHAMVYDSKNKVVILQGGTNAQDTWAYDVSSKKWTSIATDGPDVRLHGMSYDSNNDLIILWGGANQASGNNIQGDSLYSFRYVPSGNQNDSTPPSTVATPTGGTYTSAISVSLIANEPATTYYTTDGSNPSTSSSIYQSPISISENSTIKLFSIDTSGNAEQVTSASYNISTPPNGPAIEIFQGDSFETAVENLNPGDTLIIHEGTYSSSGRIGIVVQGTAEEPVIIRGADNEAKPVITRPDANQNNINIEASAAYLTIKGLEITGGADGINLSGNNHHINLEDNYIHDIGEVGLNFRSSMNNIIVRHNHIHGTHDTAEGMYIGCNNSVCVVRDSIFENNWIHDTGKAPDDSQGDGIELKQGSYNNIIRNNVIYNTNYPCILVYGTDSNPKNTVEGNVMWNCGDAGIQVQGEASVRNNIIIYTTSGIGNGLTSQNHQGTVTDLEIVNNTVVGSDSCAVLRNWSGKSNMIFANNALYCENDIALNFIGGSTGVTVSNNVTVGAVNGVSSGTVAGRSLSQDLVNAGSFNVWPTTDSPLRETADSSHVPQKDFNNTQRLTAYDVGAYETNGIADNPGWKIVEGFKESGFSNDETSPSAPKDLRRK